ncbi:MAG: hypothetical protein ACK56F_20250, partial [bacterium]
MMKWLRHLHLLPDTSTRRSIHRLWEIELLRVRWRHEIDIDHEVTRHVLERLRRLAALEDARGHLHARGDHRRRVGDVGGVHRVLVHHALDDVRPARATEDPHARDALLGERLLGAEGHVVVGGPD